MAAVFGSGNDDGRDAISTDHPPPDPVDKQDNAVKGVSPATPSTEVVEPLSGGDVSDPKATAKPSASLANAVGAGSKRRPPKAKTTAAATVKSGKPPISPTSTAAATGDRNIPFTFSGYGDSAKLDSAVPSHTEAAKPNFRKVEKCSENALRSVSELHIGDEQQSDTNKFDMEKVLKSFGARDAFVASKLTGPNIQVGVVPSKSLDVCPSENAIPGKRAPLDLTLKTTLQFVSSSSVKWCHKLSTSFGRSSIVGPIAQSYHHGCQNSGCSRPERNKEFLFSKALQSWVYPQSLLPASIISAMVSSTVRGESDFLLKRHQDWEDSFQNLYYMLRKNLLNIFYVFTPQFVALFIGGNCLDKKQTCNAYLSQSTRGIRSLL